MDHQWWRQPEVAADIHLALDHVNEARERWSSRHGWELSVADGLTKALESLARVHDVIRARELGEDATSDAAALGSVLSGCSDEDQQWLLDQQSVSSLAEFRPLVADDSIIRRQLAGEAVPEDRVIAQTRTHREFAECWDRYTRSGSGKRETLRKLGRLLQMFRNNLQHAMKTRTERDLAIAALMVRVYGDCIEAVLGHPSRYMLIYGTLAPGQPSHELLSSLRGEWTRVEVSGHLGLDEGVPTFACDRSGPLEQVNLFCSDDLPPTWSQVDEHEGPRYPRHLALYVADDGLDGVANIYEYAGDRGIAGR